MAKSFENSFQALTGNQPFPWQSDLYESWFSRGKFPKTCNLPTGLGKTSVLAIWLIALANGAKVPRRLVYVVNRRTVVDQTTEEAGKLRANLVKAGITDALRDLCAIPLKENEPPLAISTLRGQFADNREWSTDPCRPAIICGTVDMIGSRLLFSGYGVGFKGKPLHAGFLGQNSLLIHDEAHLEPAFQRIVEAIECEQRCGERTGDILWPKLQLMQLTATTRSNNAQPKTDAKNRNEVAFGLTEAEKHPPEKIPADTADEPPIRRVWRRLKAKKSLQLTPVSDDKQAAGKIALIATGYKDANAAVLVFVRTLEAVGIVEKELKKTSRAVVLLTGTMRGKERDKLVESPEFKRFSKGDASGETVYLVCTSAGEVGIDISADHMVCDLSTFESMAQRFGRVNRYGLRENTQIDVVHPAKFDDKDKLASARIATLALLHKLDGDGSPLNLGSLESGERQAAFAPPPTILPATDMLFDAWALTSIKGKMPGRPPVEPYLHGLAAWEPPETHVAWRDEVEIVTSDLLERHAPAELLEDYPLKPHELLRDATDRKNSGVFAQLTKLARHSPDAGIWIIDAQSEIKPVKLLEVINGDSRQLYGATVLLPPSIGGLTAAGTLDGDVEHIEGLSYDVADVVGSPTDTRIRVWSDDPDYDNNTSDMRCIRSIEIDMSEEDASEPLHWDWYECLPLEGGRTTKKAVIWDTHVNDVVNHAKRIVASLSLPQEIAIAIIVAAELHDHGKRRERFQFTLGNRRYPDVLLAKAGRGGARLPEPFRHEFASVLDAQGDARFNGLSEEMKDLVLHLIAVHHGRGRPHFRVDEAFDPDRPLSEAEALAIETPRRFARLQRTYGHWGLAYLESLLRAADWAASAAPSSYAEETEAKP
ncbi:MAG: type I-U CRISPR-associated helicase/endonuclease Cas3 [Verrucomicrobiales bacterium]|nr:type I-U CRISPR-associated helicase/endonuclease Cas3 [Verrucomicrobiales bacterium]